MSKRPKTITLTVKPNVCYKCGSVNDLSSIVFSDPETDEFIMIELFCRKCVDRLIKEGDKLKFEKRRFADLHPQIDEMEMIEERWGKEVEEDF